jgi:class 3 adenylate cyclase
MALVAINTISVILLSGCLYLNFTGRLVLSLTLIIIEVMINQSMVIIYMGWDIGFQYYYFAIPMAIYFTPWKAPIIKAVSSFSIIMVYILMMFYFQTAEPVIELEKIMKNIFAVSNAIGVGFVFAIFANYFNYAATTAEESLDKEHKRSENLLLNILPAVIASRLKDDTAIIADNVSSSTTLFTDIVGFTEMSEKLSPEELVIMLNEIFSRFDNLTEKHSIEKIKTIGDAYMVVGGIPKYREDYAEAVAEMALDMMSTMTEVNEKLDKDFSIRIGINSGSVVAGVIGKKKFAYDLWGDCVNTAARMESHGVPGEIQVTESSYDLLKNNYHFEFRGEIAIKGKGMMKTYFLKGRKSETNKVQL